MYMHAAGFVHRDVAARNIFFEDVAESNPKLGDIGSLAPCPPDGVVEPAKNWSRSDAPESIASNEYSLPKIASSSDRQPSSVTTSSRRARATSSSNWSVRSGGYAHGWCSWRESWTSAEELLPVGVVDLAQVHSARLPPATAARRRVALRVLAAGAAADAVKHGTPPPRAGGSRRPGRGRARSGGERRVVGDERLERVDAEAGDLGQLGRHQPARARAAVQERDLADHGGRRDRLEHRVVGVGTCSEPSARNHRVRSASPACTSTSPGSIDHRVACARIRAQSPALASGRKSTSSVCSSSGTTKRRVTESGQRYPPTAIASRASDHVERLVDDIASTPGAASCA